MRKSPLRERHADGGATFAPYGPPEAEVLLVETFGEVGLEYASLRSGCILLDQPHRGTIEVAGPDRVAFLNRMLTQELKDLSPGDVRRSFWLNRKGRIDADLRLIELGDRTILDLDVHAVSRAVEGLSAFVITEDVQIADRTEAFHRLALHGPRAGSVMDQVSPGAGSLAHRKAMTATGWVVFRDDTTGEPGLEMIVPAADTASIYDRLLRAAPAVVRPAGWHAFNIGRIEAGTPLYNIDFGPDSLPHETGVLKDRVSFRKGCYLGQEIVARMESRGHSKRSLVAITCEVADPSRPASDRAMATTGSQLWNASSPEGEPVGVVTSATLAPMLAWMPICFASVKPGANAPGTKLLVAADDDRIGGTVQPSLAFWSRPAAP